MEIIDYRSALVLQVRVDFPRLYARVLFLVLGLVSSLHPLDSREHKQR